MTLVSVSTPILRRSSYRLRRVLVETGSAVLGVVLLIWSLFPIYNMFMIALDPEEGEIEFAGNLWTPEPSLDGFLDVIRRKPAISKISGDNSATVSLSVC